MKYFLLVLFSILLFSGCDVKPENIEMKVSVVFPDGINCKTYLAENFEIVLFDSNQRKTETKTFKCDADVSEFSLFVVKEKYYITVALKDSKGNNKSYGSGYVDASNSDVSVTVEMSEYLGGVTFEWGTSFCSKYDIGVLKFTLSVEDEPVTTVVWGKESEIKNYEILCSAGYFEIVNIPTGVVYSSVINAYRTSESKTNRIEFTIPGFKLVAGQDTPVKIDEYKKVVVSDVILNWEFDSKSIRTCADANVTKVVATVSSFDYYQTIEQSCDDSFSEFRFFDLPPENYNISIVGKNIAGEDIFEGLKSENIEAGKVGKDVLKLEILIVEK